MFIRQGSTELEKEGVYQKDLWSEHGRWVQPPLPSMLYSYWFTHPTLKNIFPHTTFHPLFSIEGYFIVSKQDLKSIDEVVNDAYQNKTLVQFSERVDQEGKRVFNTILDDLKQGDSYIEKYSETVVENFGGLNSFLLAVDFIGESISRLAVETGYTYSEAELFSRASPHFRETWIEAERQTIINLARVYLEKGPDLSNQTGKYLKDFSWSRVSKWMGEPIDQSFADERIQEEALHIEQGKNATTQRVSTDESVLDEIMRVSVVVAFWRAQAAKMEAQIALRMRGLLTDIADKNNLGSGDCERYKKALLITPHELVGILKDPSRKIQDRNNILKREKEFFGILTAQGEEIILTKDAPEYSAIKNSHLAHEKVHTKTSILKGQGASPGHAKGKVRVVTSHDEYGLFQEGEVLVASDTSPSHVPLMRLAAAIITAKGGITSHAAIVSRELNKPCIIAVKNVEKILKTGDMVEVNAEKGIVTIL